MATRISVLMLLFTLSLLCGCGIPRDGIVFALQDIHGGGLLNESEKYNGRYIRSTTDSNRLGQLGGSEKHQHEFQHDPSGSTMEATNSFRPLGTSDVAASADHKHDFRALKQDPTVSGESNNEYSNIKVGIYAKRKFGVSVPKGTIIGFIGSKLPKGWILLDGTNSTPNINGLLLKVAKIQAEWGKIETYGPHNHKIDHTHSLEILKNNPANGTQTFENRPDGTASVPPVNHGHQVKSIIQIGGTTTEIRAELPSVQLNFIMALKSHSRLPRGAVVMTTRQEIPSGWSNLSTTRSTANSLGAIEQRFLAGNNKLGSTQVLDSPTQHFHEFTEKFQVSLLESNEKPAGKAISGIAEPLSLNNHTHNLIFTFSGKLSTATHLPPYVEVFFILKN